MTGHDDRGESSRQGRDSWRSRLVFGGLALGLIVFVGVGATNAQRTQK